MPGFIFQLKVSPTKQLYHTATVFIYHHIDISYLYLYKGLKFNENVQRKRVSKAYSRSKNMRVRNYHAENRRFSENYFLEVVKQEWKMIISCGVNNHFQNGKT